MKLWEVQNHVKHKQLSHEEHKFLDSTQDISNMNQRYQIKSTQSQQNKILLKLYK